MENQEIIEGAEILNGEMSTDIKPTASSSCQENSAQKLENGDDDDELEEGELKDDDDDDDDDFNENCRGDQGGDVIDGITKASDPTSDGSDLENRKASNNSDSRTSSVEASSKSSSSISCDNGTHRNSFKARSIGSSSSSIDRTQRPNSFSSRRGSKNRPSNQGQSQSRRAHSPSNNNHQARLVTMRAKLLEAKSREIEMKFQKKKVHSLPSLSTITPLTAIGNLKTTVSKPSITYAENPNPVDPPSRNERRSKSSKRSDSREKSKAKKLAKKRKRKSSSKKKKKRVKTSQASRKSKTSDKANSVSTDPSNENLDRQGPKTPPDNQVVTLDDEQVEWPSYLIKMTITQPSISYSVNPDSIGDLNPTSRSENSDLNADFSWFQNYLVNTFDMDKLQAQNQASTILISAKNYDKDVVDCWLEQQGFSRQHNPAEVAEVQLKEIEDNGVAREYPPIPIRDTKPPDTILRSHREITLPNGKVLPRGTIQRIVHPYPKAGRVTPDPAIPFIDLY